MSDIELGSLGSYEVVDPDDDQLARFETLSNLQRGRLGELDGDPDGMQRLLRLEDFFARGYVGNEDDGGRQARETAFSDLEGWIEATGPEVDILSNGAVVERRAGIGRRRRGGGGFNRTNEEGRLGAVLVADGASVLYACVDNGVFLGTGSDIRQSSIAMGVVIERASITESYVEVGAYVVGLSAGGKKGGRWQDGTSVIMGSSVSEGSVVVSSSVKNTTVDRGFLVRSEVNVSGSLSEQEQFLLRNIRATDTSIHGLHGQQLWDSSFADAEISRCSGSLGVENELGGEHAGKTFGHIDGAPVVYDK